MLLNKLCRRCTKLPQTDLKWINCNTVCHPECIKNMETINITDELSVECCDDKIKSAKMRKSICGQGNLFFSSASLKTEFSCKLEISYLKEIHIH